MMIFFILVVNKDKNMWGDASERLRKKNPLITTQ